MYTNDTGKVLGSAVASAATLAYTGVDTTLILFAGIAFIVVALALAFVPKFFTKKK